MMSTEDRSIRSSLDNLESVHQQWVATLDAIRDAICVVSSSGEIIRINAAFSSLVGFEFGQLVGWQLADRAPWLADEHGRPLLDQVMSPCGRLLRIKLAGKLERSSCMVLIFEDITDQAALRLAQEKYDAGQSRSLIETIEALSNALDAKDPYTAQHSRGVAVLARKIALAVGVNETDAQGIYYGARVHDLGKISIPSGVLSRPGKLVAAELSLIKTHSEAGFAIIKNLKFPWPVHSIVLQHHERLDGKGYPAGLKADQIHPAAKIVAVADVVEAMSSHRPYRPALGMEAAEDEILGGIGTRYDAKAVNACVGLMADSSDLFAAEKMQ